MAVTLGTFDRQAQDGRTEHIDLVDDHFEPFDHRVDNVAAGAIGSLSQEPGGHQVVLQLGADRLGGREVGEFVTGYLFQQEAVVGLVVVESADHVVAVSPRMGADRVGRAFAFRIGIAGQVEPVPSPAFTVVPAGQEAIDHPGVGTGLLVSQEGLDVFPRWGQSSQIESHASNQCLAIGFPGVPQGLLVEPLQEKRIDRVDDPVGRLVGHHLRHHWLARRLERPEVTVLVTDQWIIGRGGDVGGHIDVSRSG